MAADWSMLPVDLLPIIALKLEALEDFIYFSAVCREWNCVQLVIKNQWKPILPWLLLAENTKDNPAFVRKIFALSNTKCYELKLPETFEARCWGTPYGWVAMIDIDLNILLFNPITKARLSFPSRKTLPDAVYSAQPDEKESDFVVWFIRDYTTKLFVLKVQRNEHYEFVIAILYCSRTQLALAWHGDLSWTPVEQTARVMISEVMSVNDNVYALYNDGSIRYWHVKEMGRHPLVNPMVYIPGEGRPFKGFDEFNATIGKMYLVQSGGDLLMLLRHKEEVFLEPRVAEKGPEHDPNIVYRTLSFQVFRLWKGKKWEEIKDLGDVALFVGSNSSMCVSTAHAKNLLRNCIYFSDDENQLWTFPTTEEGGHDMGVYDIKCAQILPFYEGDSIRAKLCPPTFFIPQF